MADDVCAVVLLTWGGLPERREYANTTMRKLAEHLRYDGPLILHIADDGSPDGHVADLVELGKQTGRFAAISSSDSAGRGYGANYNAATQVVHDNASICVMVEDDWELQRELDLTPLVEALKDERIGCIRMGYLGFNDAIRGEAIHAANHTYLLLDPDSPSCDVFAGHPRIETRAWERYVGLWKEGLNPGATEFEVCNRAESRKGVVWPMDLVFAYGSLFGHVGAVQARQDQREVTVA